MGGVDDSAPFYRRPAQTAGGRALRPGHGTYLADLAFADLAYAVLLAPCGGASADRRRQSFDMSPHGRASRGIYQIDESE